MSHEEMRKDDKPVAALIGICANGSARRYAHVGAVSLAAHLSAKPHGQWDCSGRDH